MTTSTQYTRSATILPPRRNTRPQLAAVRAHDVRPRLSDTALHALVQDPDFETRDTIPVPPPREDDVPSTLRSPPPSVCSAPVSVCTMPLSSAPAVIADDWQDGWFNAR